jgi:hypothetical protein
MRLLGITLILIIYSILGDFSRVFAINESTRTASAREVAEQFCRAEFMGIQDIRLDIAKYRRKQMVWEKKRDPESKGMVKFWDNDPLFVVASYEVEHVSVKKNHAIATIVYRRLARTEGDGVLKRKIIPDVIARDIVHLNLLYDGSIWWVLDPPIPRVSLKAIIQDHKSYLDTMGDDWLERTDISEAQKQYYRKRQENLKILGALH